jgi:polysaccharide export outer membrane protein/exopolysaccharide production protein ExoF
MRLVARQHEIDRSALSVRIEWFRLRAALAGQRELGLSGDDRLRAGATLGFSRITSETEALEAELDAIEAREAANQSELADLDEQITAHESYLSMVEGQYKHHSQLLQKLRQLHAQRVASMRQREQVEMNIVDVVQAKLSVEKYLTELRAKRNSLQHRAKVEVAERRERLTRQIRDLAEENDALEAQRATVDAELAALDAGNPEDRAGSALAVFISRKFKDGTRRIEATPKTELTPSDIVTVSLAFSAESQVSLPRLNGADHQVSEIAAK